MKRIVGIVIFLAIVLACPVAFGSEPTSSSIDPVVWDKTIETGNAAARVGKHFDAIAIFERALKMAEAANNPKLIATALQNLGIEYLDVGRLDEAEATIRRALDIVNGSNGESSPFAGYLLNTLGDILCGEAKYDNAAEVLKQAIAIRKKVYDPNDGRIATSLGNLASTYLQAGKYDLVEPLLTEALAIRRNASSKGSDDIAVLLNTLGTYYRRVNNNSEAEKQFKASLAMREEVFGPKHPKVALGLNNLAEFYSEINQKSAAEPLYLRAMEIERAFPGSQDLAIASTLNNLGMLYADRNEFAKADKCLQESLAIRTRMLGSDHPETTTTYFNLGTLLVLQAKYKEALPLIQRAATSSEKVLGPNHPHTKQYKEIQELVSKKIAGGTYEVQTSMGRIHADSDFEKIWIEEFVKGKDALQAGKYDVAIPMLEKSLAGVNKLPNPHKAAPSVAIILSVAYKKAGMPDKQVATLNIALQEAEKCSPLDRVLVNQILSAKANALYLLGKYAEAEVLLKKAVALEGSLPQFVDPSQTTIYALLGQVYYKQGRLAEAATTIDRAVALSEKQSGPNSADTQNLKQWQQGIRKSIH